MKIFRVAEKNTSGKDLTFLSVLIIFLFLQNHLIAQWVQSNGSEGGGRMTCFVQVDTTLFAGTSGGVFIPTDNGNHWTAANNEFWNTGIMDLAQIHDTLIAATDGAGVIYSTDNAVAWTNAINGLPDLGVGCVAVCGRYLFNYVF